MKLKAPWSQIQTEAGSYFNFNEKIVCYMPLEEAITVFSSGQIVSDGLLLSEEQTLHFNQ